MSHPHLEHHLAFVRTVELGSITAAAQALGLARPTLSRQIAALEEALGLARCCTARPAA